MIMTKPIIKAEYIWLDGGFPTQALRSKTRLITKTSEKAAKLDNFPERGYDGSSTGQADGNDSDLILRPVRGVGNPLLEAEAYLVMCEVFESDAVPHKTNHRAKLRSTMDKGANDAKAWFGFEQEYTFYSGDAPMGWPSGGYPAPQAPFYCGVVAELAYGCEVVEEHTDACMKAGLMLFGTNGEVMPGQWEFQLGYRGNDDEDATAVSVSDELWLARWLLLRIAEKHDVRVSLECRPVKGDWNGAGMHTNFSTAEMRDPRTGSGAIENAA
jgi:glutamine synthetase